MPNQPPKLLDQVRDTLLVRHYAFRTEKSYINWIKRYILFHNKRHPSEMAEPEVEAFLTHLAARIYNAPIWKPSTLSWISTKSHSVTGQ